MAPTTPSLAQTNPDPWYDVFNGPHAQTLAILAQHANASIFDPDFKAKIEALGPSVQIPDVPMGHQYFYEGFEDNAANDNFYYLTGDGFQNNAFGARYSFGNGPLAKWQSHLGFNPPMVVNVDGPNGPLGEPQLHSAHPFCHDNSIRCSWLWAYNQYDATRPASSGGNYALGNLHGNRMIANFTATCSGSAKFSSYWDKIDRGGVWNDSSTDQHLRDKFNWENDNSTPTPSEMFFQIQNSNGTLVNGTKKFGQENDGNWGWTKSTMDFPVVAGQSYKILIALNVEVSVDSISVSNSQNCFKTVPNPFYKPPGTGNTFGGLDLSHVTEVQFNGFIRPTVFDPNTTIYFPPTDPQIGAGPCCGPFSEEKIPQLLTPTFPNGGAGDYTLAYTPSSTLDDQMKAYLNFVHAQDPSITTISINYSVASLGTGASAATYGPFVTAAPNKTVTWTWNPGGVTSNASSFWSGTPFAIGTWYGVMTNLTHNGTVTSPFFNANCTQNWWRFRAQGTMRLGKATNNIVTLETIGANNQIRRAAPRPVTASQRINLGSPARQ